MNYLKKTDNDRVAGEEFPGTGSFDEFYKQYAQKSYSLAFRMVYNHEDALDIVQEGFYRAYRSRGKFKGNSKVSTWLYRIIVNLCYDLLRRRQKEKRVEYDENYGVKKTVFNSEKKVMQDDMVDKIKKEVETLPPRQKTVFILKTYEELAYKEIANIMHSRIGTVKATYFQTVQKLRKNLREKEVIKNEM